MKSSRQYPKVEEILEHPSFPDTVWKLKPSLWGKIPVAIGRGGPFNLDWEVHGTGEIKLAVSDSQCEPILSRSCLMLMYVLVYYGTWEHQGKNISNLATKNLLMHFPCRLPGKDRRSNMAMSREINIQSSFLITEASLTRHSEHYYFPDCTPTNRWDIGIGKSDKPILRYSTSEMALDVIEIFDALRWKKKRQVHIVGVSMGGMIAQEIAYQIPDRICSLNLISTASMIENTTTFFENMQTRIRMLVPKSLERSIIDSSKTLFPEDWLFEPDCTEVPAPGTPNVDFPHSGKYGEFSTNYERYAAHELHKRLDTEAFGRKGFLLQLIAAGWHHKSPEQLKEIGDNVGRDRIMVLHGTADRMITVPHGKKLIEWLQPSTAIIKEGVGHVFMVQTWKYYNQLIENMIDKCEVMNENI